MLRRLNRKWHLLWGSPPGKRFQNYYRRTRRDKDRSDVAPRIARLVLALLLFVIGVCLIFFPLVYVPFFVASASMLASESIKFAQFLDHGELWVHKTWARTKRKYRLSRRTVHFMAVTLGMGCLVLSGFLCYSALVR
jgi:hypothetical protein